MLFSTRIGCMAAMLALWVHHGVAQVYRIGPDVTAPFVLQKTKPEYTEEARLAKLEGSVLLSLTVDADGRPRDTHVDRPLGLGLDESGMESVRHWRFRPGTKAGAPVDVRVQEEVFFHVERNLWDWHLVRAVFRTREGDMRPVVLKTQFPVTVEEEENASVTIMFDVDRRGSPVKASVLKSSDPKWEKDVLAAFTKGWRFQPGQENGTPVVVRGLLEFVRGSHSPIPHVPIPQD